MAFTTAEKKTLMRLSKILWFVGGEQINYFQKPKAGANNFICGTQTIVFLFTLQQFKEAVCHFSSMGRISFTANMLRWYYAWTDHNLVGSCYFAGHVVGSQPITGRKKLHLIIIIYVANCRPFNSFIQYPKWEPENL